MADDDSAAGCQCKVGRMTDIYDVDDADGELIDRWTRPGETESVRSLTDWFNQEILRREMNSADMEVVEGRVENLHRLLTDGDVLEAVKMEARTSLSQAGIDVEQLEDRFVSHQSVYRHLRNCLGVEQHDPTPPIEKEGDRINALQDRAEAVISDSISRLRNGDEIDVNGFEVLVNFRVMCEACGSLEDVSTLLANGGCGCRQTGPGE